MVLGCGFFAWSTGTITSLLTDQSQCCERFKDKFEEVSEYLVARALPAELANKVKSFYMLKYPTMRIYDEERILKDLPYGLRRIVQLELFHDIITSCAFFYGLDNHNALCQLCMKLTQVL